MSYECCACNYSTNDKSNYTRHLKSAAHIRNNANAKSIKHTNKFPKQKVEYKCRCGKIFSHHSSLSRHKNTCNIIVFDEAIDTAITNVVNETVIQEQIKLQEQVKELTTTVGILVKLIENNNASVQPTNNTNNNTYNISVKTYVQQNYPNAPVLQGPADYAKLTYNDAELIDTLLYKHKHKCLHEYLGNFLVLYYKKDNPSEQSVWSSDISRLTYIVKESLEDKKSIWNHDYKGVKTKKCIIDPLLQHIKTYISSYWDKNMNVLYNKKLQVDVDAMNKRQDKYNITYAIETEIDNGTLANDIIKYIASYFHMDRNAHPLPTEKLIKN